MRRHLRIFYDYVEREKLTLNLLTHQSLWQLDSEFKLKNYSLSYRDGIRHTIQQFLFWRYRNRLLDYDPRKVFPRVDPNKLERYHAIQANLPKEALEFLDLIKVTHQSWKSYKVSIKHLHAFLINQHIAIDSFNREQMEKFMIAARKRRISASTYNHRICEVRTYLRWRRSKGLPGADPETLIRNKDYAKQPEYLPRPLEHEVDQKIQDRLTQKVDLYSKGLLLLRNTGMRIGEMRDLPFNCIKRQGSDQHTFLKVPLGKLKNERHVPIDTKTEGIIRDLQNLSLKNKDQPEYLIMDKNGSRPLSCRYQFSLEEVSADLESEAPITPHRLRHTYATTLLQAGMNLVEIKELLGHRSIKMTLKYAKVTPFSIRESYYRALERIEQLPQGPLIAKLPTQSAPYKVALRDLAKSIQQLKNGSDLNTKNRKYADLIGRIQRLLRDLDELGLN